MRECFERRENDVLTRLRRASGQCGTITSYGSHADQVVETVGDVGPAVVFVHGGYFRPTIDRSHARPAAHALARCGLRVSLLEYRRVPGDPFASVADLDLFESRVTEPVLWLGHSAGGMLALTRAYRRPAHVLAFAPVADLARAARLGLGDGAVTAWMGGTPDELPERYAALDPRQRLPEWRPDVVLVHGARDRTVPVELSRDGPARAVVLPDAHHFDLVDPGSTHWPTVLDHVRSAVLRLGDHSRAQ